jgi:hypothetical protein
MTIIDLHLGVHKTATTHLQKYWVACNGLTDRVLCPPLDEVRTHLTPACGQAQATPADKAARAWLAKTCAGRARVLLSDENFIGNCEGNLARRALYPDTRQRLERLAALLGDAEVNVLVCVRSYADYLRSAYCEAIRHTPYRPFREMYKPFDFARRGWEHVVEDVLEALPGAEVTCWRYGELAQARPAVTAELFGVDASRLPAPDDRRERRTFPRLAIRLLDDVYARLGSETATQIRGSVEKVVSGPQMPRFEPWTPAETTELAAASERSFVALRELERVRFVP